MFLRATQVLVFSSQVQTTTSIVWTSAHDTPCWSLISIVTLWMPGHNLAWSRRITVVSNEGRQKDAPKLRSSAFCLFHCSADWTVNIPFPRRVKPHHTKTSLKEPLMQKQSINQRQYHSYSSCHFNRQMGSELIKQFAVNVTILPLNGSMFQVVPSTTVNSNGAELGNSSLSVAVT